MKESKSKENEDSDEEDKEPVMTEAEVNLWKKIDKVLLNYHLSKF